MHWYSIYYAPTPLVFVPFAHLRTVERPNRKAHLLRGEPVEYSGQRKEVIRSLRMPIGGFVKAHDVDILCIINSHRPGLRLSLGGRPRG